ncbi:MAG: hypothetical protein ABL890_04395 [Candidatus Peribacteraceae bacterium]
MKSRVSIVMIIVGVLLGTFLFMNRAHTPVPNPDPNHTHADFAVFLGGKKVDFSLAKYMSGLSTDDTTHDEENEYHDEHLHLHDNNGDVLHRHKPALTIGAFFSSLPGVRYEGSTFSIDGVAATVRLFVNGVENKDSANHVFTDVDQILITDATEQTEIDHELSLLTDEACLYSRTCPWKGDPPTENCIADPSIPCLE